MVAVHELVVAIEIGNSGILLVKIGNGQLLLLFPFFYFFFLNFICYGRKSHSFLLCLLIGWFGFQFVRWVGFSLCRVWWLVFQFVPCVGFNLCRVWVLVCVVGRLQFFWDVQWWWLWLVRWSCGYGGMVG